MPSSSRQRPSTASTAPPTSSYNHIRKATSYASLGHDASTTTRTTIEPGTSYFDVYPRNARTTNTRPKTSKSIPSRSEPPSPTTPPASRPSVSSRRERIASDSATPSFTFPSAGSDDHEVYSRPVHRGRTRTVTSPSSPTESSFRVPPLRFSGSSTMETPPGTPVDFRSSLDHFPAVVNVETMDALVDGMNGGDDIFGHRSHRSRFGIHGHHPLYTPPLPTPPPGVVLGGRKPRKADPDSSDSSSSQDEEMTSSVLARALSRRRHGRHSLDRMASSDTVMKRPAPIKTTGVTDIPRSAAPSISEIIRNYAPPASNSRPSTRASSLYSGSHNGHAPTIVKEDFCASPMDDDLISRSSIDSIADEVQRTLKNQASLTAPAFHPLRNSPSFAGKRGSVLSDTGLSVASPKSEQGAGSSIYSGSSSLPPHSPTFLEIAKPSPADAIATYVRSTRLTTILKLTRSPHASQDNPLTVSLSDLGDPNGIPIVVFLGLGSVRHIMGLYDDMAELMGVRLITIDRWGLGKTEPRSKAAKGVIQWAAVVEEVLDKLHIERCSVMAHSAGAPYALSFANKHCNRIRGDLCLLAPWVGGSDAAGTYKWLKYVPNGILKTAQAAEWKLHSWMIGRPPTIAYQGIGYNAEPAQRTSTHPVYPSTQLDSGSRPSLGSSSFSEYDDLRDFDGRFESRSTFEAQSTQSQPTTKRPTTGESKIFITRKKSTKFIDKIKGGSTTVVATPPLPAPEQGGKRLKGLRSMGSLKSGKSGRPRKDFKQDTSPQLPPSAFHFDVNLGLDDTPFEMERPSTQRSMSSPARSAPPSPATSATPTGDGYQVSLANALIAASHAESAKGTHNDLLQILNHENHPWGFSYSSYPHRVQVWYGDRDEKIAESAVKWMEKSMGEEKCMLKIVKGADHNLMYKSHVVVEVLEKISGFWR